MQQVNICQTTYMHTDQEANIKVTSNLCQL